MNKRRLTQVYISVDISESELKSNHTSLLREKNRSHPKDEEAEETQTSQIAVLKSIRK